MKRSKEFPFHKARRITSTEVEVFRKGIEKFEGKKRPFQKILREAAEQ